jgi:hypothetical protein
MLAVGTARRLRAVGSDEADSNAVGTDDAFGNAGNADAVAFGSAVGAEDAFGRAVTSGATAGCVVTVASGAALGLVGGAAWGLDRLVRNFVAPAVLEVVESYSVSTALGPVRRTFSGARRGWAIGALRRRAGC